MIRATGLRRAEREHGEPFSRLRSSLGVAPRGFADLTSCSGAVVNQGSVGHCTTAAAKAACTTLAASGIVIGEPSHLHAYQMALRLDRAQEYPFVPVRHMPPLQDVGSTIGRMIDVLQLYGIALYRGASPADSTDCTPLLVCDEGALALPDMIAARRRVILGPYEIGYEDRERDVQLALDAGIACVEGGWVDTAYMQRQAHDDPAGEQDVHDINGGGHAQMVVGYVTLGGRTVYRLQNSWGTSWCDIGRTWVTSEYLMSRWVVYAVQARLE